MKRGTLILCFALVSNGVGHTSKADVVELSLQSDRCAIAFALTGQVIEGCSQPSLDGQVTRSVTGINDGYFVHFDFNSNTITPDATEHLNRLSNLLSGPLAHLCIKLVGHTDTKGSQSYNLALSKKRAQAVRLFMAGPGKIDTTRLASEGRGEQAPLPGMKGSEAKNRRVEILAKKEAVGQCG